MANQPPPDGGAPGGGGGSQGGSGRFAEFDNSAFDEGHSIIRRAPPQPAGPQGPAAAPQSPAPQLPGRKPGMGPGTAAGGHAARPGTGLPQAGPGPGGAGPQAAAPGAAELSPEARALAGTDPAAAPPAPFAQKILTSTYAGTEKNEFLARFGMLAAATIEHEDDLDEAALPAFDGTSPAPGVTSRDLWRAINPPVRCRPGKRTATFYRKVIDQFAVATNPRYDPDSPEKPRAHIFIWDVTKAMHAEVPHFLAMKEQTLPQTCDWVRMEGIHNGWKRVEESVALEAANNGLPTLVLPKAIKVKLVAVVRPGGPGPDGKPVLSAAARTRGNSLNLLQALGVAAVEYYIHA